MRSRVMRECSFTVASLASSSAVLAFWREREPGAFDGAPSRKRTTSAVICKRRLRTVLRATSPFTMMESSCHYREVSWQHQNTGELTVWPMATG